MRRLDMASEAPVVAAAPARLAETETGSAPNAAAPVARAGRVLGLVLALQALRAPEPANTHKV